MIFIKKNGMNSGKTQLFNRIWQMNKSQKLKELRLKSEQKQSVADAATNKILKKKSAVLRIWKQPKKLVVKKL